MKRPPNPSYIPHIDGLRGLAVFLVLLFHLDIAVFKGGFVGVDVFFVISGFLITGMIVKEIETTGKFSFANFYARRIKRIFPAFFAMLVFATLGAILFLGAKDYAAFFKARRLAFRRNEFSRTQSPSSLPWYSAVSLCRKIFAGDHSPMDVP
jgi:peptidoglycan/LPS O-acetylase OafA/YrhL